MAFTSNFSFQNDKRLRFAIAQGCPTYGPRANVRPATRFYVTRQPVYNQLTGTNVISVRQRFGDVFVKV